MGIQTGIFPFTGKLGTAIGYLYRGKYCFRSMPSSVKQTEATRKAASDFGTASRSARLLRQALDSVCDLSYDTTFGNRLNRAMGSVLRADMEHKRGRRRISNGDLTRLSGFRVNSNTFVHDETGIVRHFGGHISVTITNPGRNIPPKANAMQYRAIALLPDFALGTCQTVVSEAVVFNPQTDQGEVELMLPVPASSQAIIVVEVTCCNDRGTMRMKFFNALDIIGVMPPMKAERPAKAKPVSKKEKGSALPLVAVHYPAGNQYSPG
ncbi:hypothetical protein [uncultured Chitinophaga sp.]|uniref:hypothetical protein n=1 Tax=uncultured Chitinophaga sp. TaxID=339340 RepID=UPI0025CBD56F|nr:hypothetical protein [uncultured Chitinophaga sp.]